MSKSRMSVNEDEESCTGKGTYYKLSLVKSFTLWLHSPIEETNGDRQAIKGVKSEKDN